jgi:hypothetical protein
MSTLLTPAWGGGWALARPLFAVAALTSQLARLSHVRDALAAPTIVFASGPSHVADHVLLGPVAAWALWGAGLVGIAGMLAGGRVTRPGLWLWFSTYAALVITLGLNVRVPERFLVWAVVGLSLGPFGEKGLLRREVSPVARLYFLVVYGSLYLSTGLMKLLEEPGWRDGSALAFDLVDRFHAGGSLAVFVSAHPLLCQVASLWTLAFEVAFVFFAPWRRTNPWILGMGAGMHLGIALLMDVGPLGWFALSLYPVLLHPDVAREAWARAVTRLPALARFAG